MRSLLLILLLIAGAPLSARCGDRWHLSDSGSITWTPSDDIPHSDHVEMTGEQVSVVLYWGVGEDGAFNLNRRLVFPLLRTWPDDTHASLVTDCDYEILSDLRADGKVLPAGKVEKVEIDGLFLSWSRHGDLLLRRDIFPSTTEARVCEIYTLTNVSSRGITLSLPEIYKEKTTDPAKGVDRKVYHIAVKSDGLPPTLLYPGDSLRIACEFIGSETEDRTATGILESEYATRKAFINNAIDSALILDTPSDIIDAEFRYAKIRAAESIIKTSGGYMHAPGGEVFYAAIWANDQAEYINPFFPFLGYDIGNESALNSFRHFARFMNDEYKPLPSSIIAQGKDIWNGAGDRGDAAMIAYGASRYALALGDRSVAEELWTLIEWCLEYCRRHLNSFGVVESDCDELEGRFPAGDANLCTSCLYLDALRSASFLADELDKGKRVQRRYRREYESLADAIESYFGADVQGFHTYRYYDGNTVLRSWICLPLIVGQGLYSDGESGPFNRRRIEGTVAALLDPRLKSEDGLLTQQGSETFWDRSTLYAMRGIFNAGYSESAVSFLEQWSRRRLLGDHVPYAVEAYPEGNQRHLSAESGLYCRIVTEGMFGMRPTGFRSFELTPSLPVGWDKVSLDHIKAFGSDFSIGIACSGDGYQITVNVDGNRQKRFNLRRGETIEVRL